ncbi:MAG: DUF4340 domain-containing protein, partial [Oscillospiraceae bacterium]|nr:DUF4340 domain-containing protein [Oscillospiraceae bacterium]
GENDYEFALDGDGKWYWTAEPDFPLKQSFVTRIVTALNDLTAVRSFEPEGDLEQYGLDEAVGGQLIVSASDGTLFELLVGTDSGENYFAKKKDTSTVYTIGASLPTYLKTDIYTMAQGETIQGLTEEQVRTITLSNTEKNFTFEKNIRANSSYVWYASIDGERLEQIANYTPTGETTMTASEHLSKVVSGLSVQTLTKCVEFKADPAKYGLDEPALRMTVDYVITESDETKTNGSYTLIIGDQCPDDPDSYYATLAGSQMVYTITSADVTPFTAALAALG